MTSLILSDLSIREDEAQNMRSQHLRNLMGVVRKMYGEKNAIIK